MVAWNKIEVAWNIIEMVALNHFTSFCTIYNLHKQYGLFAPVNKKYTNEGFKTKQTVWIFKKNELLPHFLEDELSQAHTAQCSAVSNSLRPCGL